MRTLVITQFNNSLTSALFDDDKMIELSREESEISRLGNIYVGKVKNIVKNINAAFVEISDHIQCYLSIDDIVSPIMASGRTYTKLSIGDELLVQIAKEDLKTKAPVVTTNLEYAGRYLVLKLNSKVTSVSSKITDTAEKKRLKELISPYAGDDYNFVIRTNAKDCSDEILISEAKRLKEDFEKTKKHDIYAGVFTVVRKSVPSYIKTLTDLYETDIDKIITDIDTVYNDARTLFKENGSALFAKTELYKNETLPLYNLYSFASSIKDATSKYVWLKSGANIVIEQTEALTVIDINTGKAIKGKKAPEETFLKINLEATTEIARQLRLRNISGIIIIDYIDMKNEHSDAELIRYLKEEIAKDPIKTDFVDITKLHLVELTRKKVRRSVKEQFNE